MRRRRFLPLLLALALPAGCRQGGPGVTSPADSVRDSGPAPALHVQGTRLVDALGRTVRLRGVNHSGAEFACIQGWGIFDDTAGVNAAAIAAMRTWHINAVRVPLNEDCWLGINGVPAPYGGSAYRRAIAGYVQRLNAAGIVVILDLHWGAPGTTPATAQTPMPDRDHTPEFWRQVATDYASNEAVVFDLFNEPYPDGNRDTEEAWRCWRDGGACAGVGYQAAGMQELVTAVRGAGADNVILLGGVQYAAGLSRWLAYRPDDPAGNLAASWHVYNFSYCHDRACWDGGAAPVAALVPLVLGELGQDDGGSAFVTALMDWMDARQGSYLAWTWNVWGSALDLIRSYAGTPTAYGQTFRTRLTS